MAVAGRAGPDRRRSDRPADRPKSRLPCLTNAPPPATRDSLPGDTALQRRLEAAFARNARAYGFAEIATPTFERADLFSARSGPEIKSSLLTFHCDHEEYALRPEMTAPVCRLVASGALGDRPRPYKLFYVAPCFRYCRPHSGGTREFTQAGIELLGDASPAGDAEVIAAASRFLREIGIGRLSLKIGTAGIFRAILPEELTPDERAAVIGHLDRLAAIGERCSAISVSGDPLAAEQSRSDRRDLASLQTRIGYTGEFAINDRPSPEPEAMAGRLPAEAAATYRHLWNVEGYLPDETAEILLRASAIRGSLEEVSALAADALAGSQAGQALDDLMSVCQLLGHYGIEGFDVALGIGRGLTFYTGTVFEISSGAAKLCGGGRYDRLVELFGGEPTPATGCAVRFDRLRGLVRNQTDSGPVGGIVLKAVSRADQKDAVRLAEQLRDRGIPVGCSGMPEASVTGGKVRLPGGTVVRAEASAMLEALPGDLPAQGGTREIE